MEGIGAKTCREIAVLCIVERTSHGFLLCMSRLRIRVFFFSFFISPDRSDKGSCCKMYICASASSASKLPSKRSHPRYGRSLHFTKAPRRAFANNFLHSSAYFFLLFSVSRRYSAQMRAFFGDGSNAYTYVLLLNVPRCLLFYRDISRAFRISWTIREMFSATICNSPSRFPRYTLRLIMIEDARLFENAGSQIQSLLNMICYVIRAAAAVLLPRSVTRSASIYRSS